LYSVSASSGCCNSGVVDSAEGADSGVSGVLTVEDSYINSGVRWK
jgi:hypothetical protein